MSAVFIDHFSYALGEVTQSVAQAAASGQTRSSAPVLQEAGFVQHHLCRDGTTAYDLARRAVAPLREHLADTGAIIYATCLPCNGNMGSQEAYLQTRDVKHLMDFPASHLQADLGLHRAIVVGLHQQACTGMLGALHLARLMLCSEPDTAQVLCVTADRFPGDALYEQSYNLISDGAVACLVSTVPRGFRLVVWHGITNGALAQASDDETVGSYFTYTHRVIQETLVKAQLGMQDMAYILPQNTHRKAWQILTRLLRIDDERVCCRSLPDVAHLISGDNLVNLMYLEQEGQLRRGEHVLLVMAGYGLNWQCVILEKM